MTVGVTGASGFIGSHVVDLLVERGIDVIAFDRHQHRQYPDGVSRFLGDIRDAVAVTELAAICDGGVIHLAGVLGTQETIDNPIPAAETNVLGGLNVLQGLRQYRRRGVYIAVGNHWMNNSYSITKTTTERLALMFNKEHGTEIAVVRGLNAYGPRQHAEPVRKIMPNFILPCLTGNPILIYGDGEQVMDMAYVRDVGEALVRALLDDHGVYDRPFEAGSGRDTTVNQIAEAVINACGGGSVTHVPMRPGEPERSVVLGDPATLKPLGLDAGSFRPLEEGLIDTVEYFRSTVVR